jgi:hypothetical protein
LNKLQFHAIFGSSIVTSVTTAKDSHFDNRCAPVFSRVYLKFSSPAEVDRLARLSIRINDVKLAMQDNIQQALVNCVQLETLEVRAGRRRKRRLQ